MDCDLLSKKLQIQCGVRIWLFILGAEWVLMNRWVRRALDSLSPVGGRNHLLLFSRVSERDKVLLHVRGENDLGQDR